MCLYLVEDEALIHRKIHSSIQRFRFSKRSPRSLETAKRTVAHRAAVETVNITMRAIELYETNLAALGIKRDGTGEQKLTLRALNKLKRIREKRRSADDKKRALRRAMYGGGDLFDRTEELEQARAELELAQKEAELKLTQKRQDIEHAIETAKLSDEAREKVSALAQETLGRRLKA